MTKKALGLMNLLLYVALNLVAPDPFTVSIPVPSPTFRA